MKSYIVELDWCTYYFFSPTEQLIFDQNKMMRVFVSFEAVFHNLRVDVIIKLTLILLALLQCLCLIYTKSFAVEMFSTHGINSEVSA